MSECSVESMDMVEHAELGGRNDDMKLFFSQLLLMTDLDSVRQSIAKQGFI